MAKTFLVTGGSGFLGSALVRRLIQDGNRVRVFDNESRGSVGRLDNVADSFDHVVGDIRDPDAVDRAVRGVDTVCHLAFVNGTGFFYSKPELVLDVGVRGMINVLDGCLRWNVPELVLFSSSEVYHDPPVIPTSEVVPLSIPDPANPRYSYAAGKIISEIMALNYGRDRFARLLIIRPHNVYGPAMGWEHVIPQFILRMKTLAQSDTGTVCFPIQGTGQQTRSFVFIDDFTDGLMHVLRAGTHLQTYNIGTEEEVAISKLARMVGEYFGKSVEVMPGKPASGGPTRRCPDISKLRGLGYTPRNTLADGLAVTAHWYVENAHLAPPQWDAGRDQWQF